MALHVIDYKLTGDTLQTQCLMKKTKTKETLSSLDKASQCKKKKSQQQKLILTLPAVATIRSAASRDRDSFLPPHFGFFDRPEVWVVDHAVLVSLCGGNDPAGRQHGVLFFGSGIILEDKMVADRKQCSLIESGKKPKENGFMSATAGSLTAMMFPAAFSLSVWSSCSDESVSSRLCNSSSEGRRALRYGMELGRAAMTGDTQIQTPLSKTLLRTNINAPFSPL